MKSKLCILLMLTFLILSISTMCFATNTESQVKNTINGATNTIIDGSQNLAEDVRNGVGRAEGAIENGVSDIGNAVMDGTDDAYTATRSSAEDVTMGNSTNASMWIWIAVAVAAVVIVGLVWYYATQNKNKD